MCLVILDSSENYSQIRLQLCYWWCCKNITNFYNFNSIQQKQHFIIFLSLTNFSMHLATHLLPCNEEVRHTRT